MKGIIRRRPSPSMIVAGTALVVALAGTAIAGPLATDSAFTKPEKKQTRKIAKSVANSEIAKAGLKTSSAFNQSGTNINSLGTSPVNLASATIKTQSSGRILAGGSAQIFGADSDEVGLCRIQIDGTDSLLYESSPDDIGTGNNDIIAVNFAVTRPAGTYTATLQCWASAGTVGKTDAAISVYGLGT